MIRNVFFDGYITVSLVDKNTAKKDEETRTQSKQQDVTQEPKQVSFGESKVADSDLNAADGTSKKNKKKSKKLKTFLDKGGYT